MKVAVGTMRTPKLEAVRQAFASLEPLGWPGREVEVIPVEAPSGEADTPLSDAGTIAGARRRARQAFANVPKAALGIGLEGGVAVVASQPSVVVLRNWVAAWDGVREGLGGGPSLPLPDGMARAVLAGEDLAAVIDRWAAGHDIRSGQGTFGVLTGGLVTRADAFRVAVLIALAPWYNSLLEA